MEFNCFYFNFCCCSCLQKEQIILLYVRLYCHVISRKTAPVRFLQKRIKDPLHAAYGGRNLSRNLENNRFVFHCIPKIKVDIYSHTFPFFPHAFPSLYHLQLWGFFMNLFGTSSQQGATSFCGQ